MFSGMTSLSLHAAKFPVVEGFQAQHDSRHFWLLEAFIGPRNLSNGLKFKFEPTKKSQCLSWKGFKVGQRWALRKVTCPCIHSPIAHYCRNKFSSVRISNFSRNNTKFQSEKALRNT